jgi:hypothetical protein
MGLGIFWEEVHDVLEVRNGPVQVPRGFQSLGQVGMRPDKVGFGQAVVGVEFESLLVMADGPVQILLFVEDEAQVEMGLGKSGVNFNGLY